MIGIRHSHHIPNQTHTGTEQSKPDVTGESTFTNVRLSFNSSGSTIYKEVGAMKKNYKHTSDSTVPSIKKEIPKKGERKRDCESYQSDRENEGLSHRSFHDKKKRHHQIMRTGVIISVGLSLV